MHSHNSWTEIVVISDLILTKNKIASLVGVNFNGLKISSVVTKRRAYFTSTLNATWKSMWVRASTGTGCQRCQQVLLSEVDHRSPLHAHGWCKHASKGIHRDFETQTRHHQKSITGVSAAPTERTNLVQQCRTENFKYHLIRVLDCYLQSSANATEI